MNNISNIKQIINNSDVIIITAGAGIGVDSGLPDFRSNDGFWKTDLKYEQIANPKMLHLRENDFWDFYNYRLDLYRKTIPHDGFYLLLDLCKSKDDYFVYTSNVDEQFQKAGFENVYEIHGSIHRLQCSNLECDNYEYGNSWFNNEPITQKHVCPKCGETARPNILLFSDWEWDSKNSDIQEKEYQSFLERNENKKICIIEIGAGTKIPSVRYHSEHIFESYDAEFIRINLNETDIPENAYIIQDTALTALTKILK